MSIEEKPKIPKGNHAVVGLYFYQLGYKHCEKLFLVNGEVEITSVNLEFLKKEISWLR